MGGEHLRRPEDLHVGAQAVPELGVLSDTKLLPEDAVAVEKAAIVGDPVEHAPARRSTRQPPRVEQEVGGGSAPVLRRRIANRARDRHRARPVRAKAARDPAGLGAAIRGEEGDESRARRGDADVSRRSGVERLRSVHQGNVESRLRESARGISSSGVHHHDLRARFLIPQRTHGVDEPGLVAEADDDAGEASACGAAPVPPQLGQRGALRWRPQRAGPPRLAERLTDPHPLAGVEGHPEWDRGGGRNQVEGVQTDAGDCAAWSEPVDEQPVEAAVQSDIRQRRGRRRSPPPARRHGEAREEEGRAELVRPAKVEREGW